MKPSTYVPISFEQLTSTGTANIKTATIPVGTSAVLISVETTNARISFHGADPSATVGHVYPKDQIPALVILGPGTSLRIASTAAADSVVGITYIQ